MSGECDKCGEHALECACAHNGDLMSIYNAGLMSIRIMQSITESPSEQQIYSPDAILRVFVYLAKANGWNLERIKKEAIQGIQYYYEKE